MTWKPGETVVAKEGFMTGPNARARIVAEYWAGVLLSPPTEWPPSARECLSGLTLALGGETDPYKLGIDEDSPAWRELQELNAIDRGEQDLWEVEIGCATGAMPFGYTWKVCCNDQPMTPPALAASRSQAIELATKKARLLKQKREFPVRVRLEV